jgi:hypothetical protein
MKKYHVPLALLALALAFPPCDRVLPATNGARYGELQTAGNPEERFDRGFVFIASVGGPVQIRFSQWLFVMTVLGGVTYFLRGGTEK